MAKRIGGIEMDKEKIYENSFFIGVDKETIDVLVDKYFEFIKFEKDSIIIEENSIGDSVYLLLEGEIIIDKNLIPLFEDVEVKKEDKLIRNINSDFKMFFGEMSLFDKNYLRTANIISNSDVKLLKLSKSNFDKIMENENRVSTILLKNIALKLTKMLDDSYKENVKLITAFTMALKS